MCVYQCHIRASAGRETVDECVFGSNDQSWSLDCSPSSYSFRHNKIKTRLPVKSIIRRIGVFVDHRAGNSVLLQRL